MKRLYAVVPREIVEKPGDFRSLAPAALAAFQALWRPELLAAAEELPEVRWLDDLPDEAEARAGLAIVPGIVAHRTPGLAERFGKFLALPPDADAEAAAPLLGLPALEADLAADFHAFGFAVWMHDALHAAMACESSLDRTALLHELHAAAEAVQRGELDGARHHLRMAWEALHSARQAVFPASINLLDLAMLHPAAAETGWTPLCDRVPWNVLASGAELDRLAAAAPGLLAKLKDGADRQMLDVLGGLHHDAPWGALPIESKLWQLDRARQAVREHFDRDLSCFAARGLALDCHMPALLSKHQFRYALHLSLSGGQWPKFREAKIKWGGPDGATLEALTGPVVDAGDPGNAFVAIRMLGTALKDDRGPALLLVHWFGKGTRWLDDWRRGERYAPAAGNFRTVGDYFLHSSYVSESTPTYPEDYVSEVFAAPADAVSRLAVRHARRARLDAARTLAVLEHIASKGEAPPRTLAALAERHETDAWTKADDDALRKDTDQALKALAALAMKGASGNTPGYLVFNPTGATARLGLRNLALEANVPLGGPVKATQPESKPGAGDGAAVVDVPGWGFSWLPARAPADAVPAAAAPPLGQTRRLRNELVEAELDRRTGGLRGVWDVRTTFSRFGQQLVHSAGSQMLCADIRAGANHAAFAELVSAGELRAPERGSKKVLATFKQTYRMWRRRPLLEIEIELRPKQAPTGAPEDDYFGCRWAWADAKTLLQVSDGGPLASHQGERMDAPRLLDFRERQLRTLLLPGGIARHRRTGPQTADTPLIVRGETARNFRMALALDVPQPLAFAQADAAPPLAVRVENGPPACGAAGWFARLASPNIHAVELAAAGGAEPAALVRLLETAGESGRSDLHACQPPEWARLVNGLGELIFTLYPVGDAVSLDFGAKELLLAELGFGSRRTESGPAEYGD